MLQIFLICFHIFVLFKIMYIQALLPFCSLGFGKAVQGALDAEHACLFHFCYNTLVSGHGEVAFLYAMNAHAPRKIHFRKSVLPGLFD